MNKTVKRRLLAGALTAVTVLPLAGGALAAPPAVSTDEAVYVNLDYYGALNDMRIVKGVSLNGETAFTDYGDYSEVYNMSTHDKPEMKDGAVSWNLPRTEKQRFYYECIPTDASALQMPWTFDVSYKLDGAPVKAEQCTGADGLVEITVHAIPNPKADEYYRNNMTLMVMTGIDMDKTRSIDAPGAQIQSLGSYKMVVFLGLPGEDNTYTIRIGSSKFESTGVIMMMAPATMSQLDRISDFRDMKDKVGDAGDDLYAGLSDLLDTVSSMQGGLSAMSAGIAGLEDVRRQLIESRGTLDPDTDQSLASLQKLVDQMDSMVPELTQTQENLTRLQSSTDNILDIVTDSQQDIEAYRKALKNLAKSLRDVTDLLNDLDNKTYGDGDMDFVMSRLQNALKDLSSASRGLSDSLGSLESGLGELAGSGLVTDPAILKLLQSGALSGLTGKTQDMLSAVDALAGAGNSLLALADSYLDVFDDHSGAMSSMTDSAAKLTEQANTTFDRVDGMLDELPALQGALDDSVPVLNSILSKTADLLTSTKETLASANQTMADLQNTLRSVREQADGHTAQSIDGLLDMMQKALDSSGTNKSLQTATDSIHGVIKNEVDDLESDTNVLNMDNSLALQSFTSSKNASPASLQFILRTEELSVDETEKLQEQAREQADEGVFQRILNIFRKLYHAIASVFTDA